MILKYGQKCLYMLEKTAQTLAYETEQPGYQH